MTWNVYESKGWNILHDVLVAAFPSQNQALEFKKNCEIQFAHLPTPPRDRFYVKYTTAPVEVIRRVGYVVCNRLLDPETWEHCEYDGDQEIGFDGSWRCPTCGALRYGVQRWLETINLSKEGMTND